ncbi:MAG: 2-succinyl-5-enolpyruvyl-6-hydroxy-3-cyclohexene-1-carboxylic-acid synthase [Solirubrobacteraceae bacterium]
MTATDTYLLLRAFCDELARCGLRHAATSPGSRCAPIVLSLVRHPDIQCWSHIDERCGGFFALGAAKASGHPALVACTSGTAAANLVPAVTEAFWARVPLIVLTADRPPELRDVGAGQTIDQLKLYGDAVKWFVEVGVHDATPARLRWIRSLACRAYWTALEGPPGPVHLNFPLREPLVMDDPLPEDPTGRAGGRPHLVSVPAPQASVSSGGAHPSGRIVIVAGGRAGSGERIAEIAARSAIPLLADPLSGARHGPAAVAHYDMLLRDPRFVAEHRPQFVLRVGDLPTSKPLRTWLAGLDDIAQIAIHPDGSWHDPDSVVGMRLSGMLPDPSVASEPGWLEAWRAADNAAEQALVRVLGDELSEPRVVRSLADRLPADALLYIASSMPIRDVELFGPARTSMPRMVSNRGANGIDGTVSSAFGAAAAGDHPVVLLTGDLALVHDIGGLLAARRLGLRLTIVLLNNNGGGIFHFLPIAGQRDVFEEHIATPTGLDFEQVAGLFGCAYTRPTGLPELGEAIDGALRAPGTKIVEIRTDREENLALHRRAAQAVAEALG